LQNSGIGVIFRLATAAGGDSGRIEKGSADEYKKRGQPMNLRKSRYPFFDIFIDSKIHRLTPFRFGVAD
jgi:hypothetical protein